MTNQEFAARDPIFRRACELAKVQPTKRQASKYQRECGQAHRRRREAETQIREERGNAA